jgi:hypothetical protein
VLPEAWHQQTEHEVAVAYAEGLREGYERALREFAATWSKDTGEEPRTFRGSVRWIIKDIERHGVAA